jgi:hypothetical protein
MRGKTLPVSGDHFIGTTPKRTMGYELALVRENSAAIGEKRARAPRPAVNNNQFTSPAIL